MTSSTIFNGNTFANAPYSTTLIHLRLVPLADVLGIDANNTKARLWAEYVDRDVIATRAYRPTKNY